MNSLESYMNRIKGRLWMHIVGNTLMDGQHISFDDTSEKHLRNEAVRRHIFPFVSFSEFYNDGYKMLKDYYMAMPASRTWSFINYLTKLWIEDRVTIIKTCHELAKDPVERARVAEMNDEEYAKYLKEYFKKHHSGIARTRKDFMRYAKMDDKEIKAKIRQVRSDMRNKVWKLEAEIGLATWFRFRAASMLLRLRNVAASSMFIALIAVSLAESLKMIVVRLFDWAW